MAESARWIALRNVVSRMLGWSPDQAEAVDLALRGIRFAAMRRAVLILCGGGDLVPIAEELHRRTLTAARPFVLCNPRRRSEDDAEGAAGDVASGVEAVEAAAGGTVCLLHKNLPADLDDMLHELRQPHCQAQLVLCAANVRDAALFAAAPVIVPGLTTRKAEIDRIIREYAAEAAAAMGIGEHWLSPIEHAWIRDHPGESLPDIQRATLRLAAIRCAGSMSAGAVKVGISHTMMRKWLVKHRFPNLALLRGSNDPLGEASD